MFCPSCGGEYADWAHKCPYCGSINEKADEQLYLQHLEEIRHRLDHADEEVVYMAYDYSEITDNIFYLINNDVISYRTQGEFLERISKNISYFYQEYSQQDRSYRPERFSAVHLDTMARMEQDIKAQKSRYYDSYWKEDGAL